ncbi:hypothetical protein HGM15179_010061 [Zosterops borbonicus]|uniref:Uncharacterized protein n=1 Tax=Zosterops borbonicus TaxID=364589 RepID=A0A8K1LKJ6_9PASS|nr:hypothetical protein HGM15179_010061 [Zosterops borbonicus]
MDQASQFPTEEDLSTWGNMNSQELCLWEEVTVQDLLGWEEEVPLQDISPCGECVTVVLNKWDEHEYGRCQELSLWGEEVTGQELSPQAKSEPVQVQQDLCQWDDNEYDKRQELSLWGEEVTGQDLSPRADSEPGQVQQELNQWDDDDNDRWQGFSLWEEKVTGQEKVTDQEEVTGPREGQGCQELCLLDEDVLCQWEEIKRDIELGQVGVEIYHEPSQGKESPQAAKWENGQSSDLAPWSFPGGSRESMSQAARRSQGFDQEEEWKQLEPTQSSGSLHGGQAFDGQPGNESPSFFRRILQCLCCCLAAQPED